jgi:tetratricopeptide (TPR) repeat protein
MASKVNTKFVLIAGSVVVLAVIGVAFVGLRMMNAGGEQNITRGDDYMKAGELRKAINEYGRAVNKDRGNAQWIRTWLGAIEKYTPTTRQQYDDMYRQEYTPALRALCDADRTNMEPFKRVMEERHQTIQRTGTSLAAWESLVRDFEELSKIYRGDQKGRDVLGRYRGLARAGILLSNSDLDQRFVDEGIKDLRAALAVDPSDAESVIALAAMLRSQSEKAAKAGRDADRDRLAKEASEAIAGFLKQNPDSQRVKFSVLADEINSAARSGQKNLTYLDIFKASKDKIADLVTTVTSAPPEKADPLVALAIAPWAVVTLTEGQQAVDAMLANVRKGHADDAEFLLRWARFCLQVQKPEQAIELAKVVVALPDKPMSLQGALLSNYRADGVRTQADASFVSWEMEKDPAKKAELVKRWEYSARKKSAKRIEEYSVWYPPTSSCSHSALSKGARLASARMAIMKMIAATGWLVMSQPF